jgi:5-methylcytosine-specific restriction protein A
MGSRARRLPAQPENQFCVKGKERGLLNPGNLHADGSLKTNRRRIGLVFDHKTPHRGDQRLFWDRANWQLLCHDDHDTIKQREEHGRENGGVDIDGRPTDPDHLGKQEIDIHDPTGANDRRDKH